MFCQCIDTASQNAGTPPADLNKAPSALFPVVPITVPAPGPTGIESALVNGPVKWLFRRTRPVHHGPRPMPLRQPRTSSFPSGHATAAFFGAALLRDDDPLWPLYYVIAVIVAASRVHVRIHHASDVMGGIAIGVLLGEVTRQLVPVGSRAALARPPAASSGLLSLLGNGASPTSPR